MDHVDHTFVFLFPDSDSGNGRDATGTRGSVPTSLHPPSRRRRRRSRNGAIFVIHPLFHTPRMCICSLRRNPPAPFSVAPPFRNVQAANICCRAPTRSETGFRNDRGDHADHVFVFFFRNPILETSGDQQGNAVASERLSIRRGAATNGVVMGANLCHISSNSCTSHVYLSIQRRT